MKQIIVVLGLAVAAVLLAGCGGGESASEAPSAPLSEEAQAGKRLVTSRCSGCHTSNGKPSSGPTFKGLAGSTVNLADGSTVVADDAYLLRAIVDPEADVVRGYPKTVMSSAAPKGSISDADARRMVEYLKTIK